MAKQNDPSRSLFRYADTMKILSLNCNHCGAPLDVPVKAKFVTCGFCDCRLAIQHSGNTHSTEVLEQLVEKTSVIQDDVNELKRRARLSELDLDWERNKRRFVVKGKNGSESLPSALGMTIQGVVGIVFACFALVLFPPIGMLVLVILGVNLFSQMTKYSGYQSAIQRYQTERRRLTSRSNSSSQSLEWD